MQFFEDRTLSQVLDGDLLSCVTGLKVAEGCIAGILHAGCHMTDFSESGQDAVFLALGLEVDAGLYGYCAVDGNHHPPTYNLDNLSCQPSIVIFAMFVSRLGPICFIVALNAREEDKTGEVMPDGRIMVG